MICLYDGEVFTFTPEDLEKLDSTEMFLFFKNGHEKDIFAMYDDKQYLGAISYNSLMSSANLSESVLNEMLVFDELFWKKSYTALVGYPDKVLPVFNRKMEMLYLVRYKKELEQVWEKLCILRSIDVEISGFWASSRWRGKHFHITGCNMVLYYFREWLLAQGICVSVSGEQWELFGVKEEENDDNEAVEVDENCREIEYLYDEYMYHLRVERAGIRRAFAKEFVKDAQDQGKIMFWIPDIRGVTPMFNIISLALMYLKKGKSCMFVMPSRDNFLQYGSHYMKSAVRFMEQVQQMGGDVCSCDDLGKILQERYAVCYTTIINFVPMLPSVLRERIDTMVVVQPWAFFMHYYYCFNPNDNDTFDRAFTDDVRNTVDFYIASDFMADWICQQDERWSEKILRFGYPKQDMLYDYLHGEKDIPKDWLTLTEGKKVFLFTELEESWLDYILKEDGQVVILRPHPGKINKYKNMFERLVEISGGKIILDDRISYYASFYLADAMITEPLCSVGINYLSMGKPLLFRSNVVNEASIRIDFRQDGWYKAAYIGANDQDIFEFMDMVRRGEDVKKTELEEYRSRMISDFDGKVCERIYNYFEEYKN